MADYKEYGFYHPDRGYWQSIGYPSPKVLATFPEGTQEIPVQTGMWDTWDGEKWVPGRMPEDKAAMMVRYERDTLLTETDWTMNPDAPTDKEAWGAYRQTLRDITGQEGFPYDIVWPTKPV